MKKVIKRQGMKKLLRVLMLVVLVIPFCACADDDEYAGLTEETKALRKKYNEKMVGDWTYELQNERIKYYSLIHLDRKGNYTETEKVAMPHTDEQGAVTWVVEYDETSTGTWYLQYVESNKRNTFNVNMNGMIITRIFYGIHDEKLLMSTAFTAAQAAYERGTKEPSF